MTVDGTPTVNNPGRVPPAVEAVEPVQEGTPRVIHPVGGAAQRVGSVAAYQEQAMQPLNAFPEQGDMYVTIEQDVTLLSDDKKDSISFVAGQKVHKSQAVRFGLVDDYRTILARPGDERPDVAPGTVLDGVPAVSVETESISFDLAELERLGLVADPERFKAAVEAGELRQLVAIVATPGAVDWGATITGFDPLTITDGEPVGRADLITNPGAEMEQRSAPGAPDNAAASGAPENAAAGSPPYTGNAKPPKTPKPKPEPKDE